MLPATDTEGTRRRRGCAPGGCLMTLLLLLILIGASWLFIVRPYVHTIAQNELDQSLTSAVNQIPAQASQLPASTVQIHENAVTNLIVLNLAPSNPVQKPATHITTNNISLAFQLYGQPCTITMLPQTVNGKLVATNVTVQGIIGLIMSPEEMTALLNKHFSEAQDRIKHSVQAVQLKEGEMDLTLG